MVVVSILVMIPLCYFIFYTAEDSRLILLRSNSTIILYDSDQNHDHDFSGGLRVTEDTGHPGDFDHEIRLYIVDSECSGLEVTEEIQEIRGTDFSLINGTTTYALAGSSMTYNICGSANSTYQLERLELVLLDELEDLRSPFRDSYHKFYYFPHGTHGNWECNQVIYSINKDGYYTPVFLTAPREANFVFTVSFQFRFIATLSLVPNYNLTADKQFVQFPLTQHHCVVASICEDPNIQSPYVHVQISYKYCKYSALATVLSLIILSLLTFFNFIFLGIYCSVILRCNRS
jgi:hypothetical protein